MITIDHQGVTTPQNAELRIPYGRVFDVPPPPLGISHTIIIPNAELQAVVRLHEHLPGVVPFGACTPTATATPIGIRKSVVVWDSKKVHL